MNVLSLFDGISCARVALERVGIPIKSYTAYEIDKYAIEISKKNFPTNIHKGNVKELKEAIDIDLLIGGSPCQDLSIAKKGRKGLEGDRSGLFWEYVRIKELCKPKWFILENVASMSSEAKDTITTALGVEPVMINASLVSAQSRKRLFWTNIKFDMPTDKGILLKDILLPDSEVDEEMTSNGKAFCLDANYHKGSSEEHSKKYKVRTLVKQLGYIGNSNSQGNRVYDISGKSVCLSANGGGSGAKTGLYKIGRDIGRRLTSDGIRADDDKTIKTTRRIELRHDDKCGTLTSVMKDNLLVSESIIRRLTPIECERLQGLPDNYTADISNTQRYKCLGNAFNVDVIASILTGLSSIEF